MMPESAAPGVLRLLLPKVRVKINRARSEEGRGVKVVVLGIAAAVFWTVPFAVIHRMLLYFRGTQGIGDLLAGKLLGMALMTFVMILLLSNVITALSTFFLSDDLELLAAAPLDPVRFYGARLVETVMDSSWIRAAEHRRPRALPAHSGRAGLGRHAVVGERVSGPPHERPTRSRGALRCRGGRRPPPHGATRAAGPP